MKTRTRMAMRGILLAALLLAGCGRRDAQPTRTHAPRLDPALLDGSNAMVRVEAFVRIGPRASGTPGAATAAHYLAAQLRDAGLDPLIDEFTDETPEGPRTFRNVIAERRGSTNRTIVLLSHYDTKAGVSDDFVGANDSGSSTGLLLELAALFARHATVSGPDLLFAFVDGEEALYSHGPRDGLHGSRRLAGSLVRNERARRVAGVLVLDMIGDRNLGVTVPRNSSASLVAAAFRGAEAEGVRRIFRLSDYAIVDDHAPFLEAGMPAVDLIDFEYGSAPGLNDYWHTSQDTLDKVAPASLQAVGRVAIRMVNELR